MKEITSSAENICLMTLKLDREFHYEVWFCRLPTELKLRLLRLEELSRNAHGRRGRFVREKHYLPLSTLKAFIQETNPDVVDLKGVSARTDDSEWLVSTGPINTVALTEAIKRWVKEFYIDETVLKKRRSNEHNAKDYAELIIERLTPEWFAGAVYSTNIRLVTDNGHISNSNAFSLLPKIVADKRLSQTDKGVSILDKTLFWEEYYNGYLLSNKIVLDNTPYSIAAKFSVQTLPPDVQAYLNIEITTTPMREGSLGLSHLDRETIFNDLTEGLIELSTELHPVATRINTGPNLDIFHYFDLDGKLIEPKIFHEKIQSVLGNEFSFGICYEKDSEECAKLIKDYLSSHLPKNYPVELDELFPGEQYPYLEENRLNFMVLSGRLPASGSFSKDAIRKKYLEAGALTKFFVQDSAETQEEQRAHILNTIFDAYRRLGLFCSISSESDEILTGIYSINYKNLENDIAIMPFPLLISFDLKSGECFVETSLLFSEKYGYSKPQKKTFHTSYRKFPIELQRFISEIGQRKRIMPNPDFLKAWFEYPENTEIKRTVIIESDSLNRKFLDGISNIWLNRNTPKDGVLTELSVDKKNNKSIDVSKCVNTNLIRIRTSRGGEVPDYYPERRQDLKDFLSPQGIYTYRSLFYSVDDPAAEDLPGLSLEHSRMHDDEDYKHRRLVEVVPLFMNTGDSVEECVAKAHASRQMSIQFANHKTILPAMLHYGMLLEEDM